MDKILYDTPEYPRQLRLDTTTTCNARCLSCHRFLSTRQGKMSTQLLEQILQDVSKWDKSLVELVPVNYGEFFTNDNWLGILKLISYKLPKTNIVIPTNGALLNEEKLMKLCTVPTVRLINFSINAYFPETYETFMGLPASNLGNIVSLTRVLRKYRSDITIWASMVFSPIYQTDLERDKFLTFWKREGIQPQVLSASGAGRGGLPVKPVQIPCRSIFSDIVVGYDRKLSSCCWDAGFKLDLGSYTGNLKQDWNNDKLTELRRKHNNGERASYDLCKSCTSA